MASGVTLKAAGLNISPNLLELPAGSLVEAKNVIIRRDDIIESRRGFALYGEELPDPNETVKQLFTYKQRILRHYSNKIQFQNGTNNDGTVNFELFSGNYSETETGLRIKSIEANGNFYFTTSEGIKKLSAASGDQLSGTTITPAGIPKAIDLKANLITTLGDQESFFTQNGVVAYRILWGKKDANNNLILGAPSESVQLYNPLTQLMIRDFNNLLNRLDILKDSTSMINDGNYASTLALNYTDTATELSDALTNSSSGLFAKLDQDILYSNPFPCTISIASPAVITYNNHGLVAGQAIKFSTTGSLPTGITAGTTYYVLAPSTNTFNIEASIGGGAITTSGSQSGTQFFSITPLAISSALYLNGTFVVKFPTSSNLTNYFSAGKNLKLIEFGNTCGVPINNNYSIININDSLYGTNVNDNITFTIQATEIGIASVSAAGVIVTTASHNIPNPLVGTVRVEISGVSGSDANGIKIVTAVGGTSQFTVSGVTIAGTSGTLKIYSIDTVSISASTKIQSNQYRSIPSPLTIDEPGTQAQLLSIQSAIVECISRLQQEQSGVIPIAQRNQYIDDLGETTTAFVQLEFSVPDGIDSTNFYQIYRTTVTTPPDTEFLSSFNAGDEMALVYEAFPTTAELSAKTVSILDETPDLFRGANLYTNPTTGEGILQANDQPPYAKDINTFKNSIFYANTKTKQRYSLGLIGVEQMVQNYSPNDKPDIVITDGTTTNQYEFVLGQKEKTRVSIIKSSLAISDPASYFTLNSANNETEYYVWYQNGTTTDPVLSGKTAIKVAVSATDTDNIVATKTISALAPYVQDFSIVKSSDCTISNSSPAIVTTNNHGLANNQPIQFTTTGILPSPLVVSTTYYVVNSSTNTFQLSSTDPSSSTTIVNTTTDGSGTHTYSLQTSNNVLIQNTNDGFCTDATTGVGSGLTVSVITPGIGEDPSNNQVLLSQSLSPSIAIEETTKSLVRVINRSTTSNIYAYYTSGIDQTPGKIFLEGKSLSDLPFYIVADSTTTGESFTPDLSPDYAISSIQNGPFDVTISFASPAVLQTLSAHGLLVNDTISLSTTGSLPSPLSPSTVYYVSGVLSPTQFTISATMGGLDINTISPGSGTHSYIKVSNIFTPITYSAPDTIFDLNFPCPYSIGNKVVIVDANTSPSIDGVYTIKNVSGNTFTVVAPANSGGTRFSVRLASDSEFSSNEQQKHRIYYSKTNQPEAVPILNYFDVGASDKAILRIFPLRDSLFVFKEDGLFRVSGESAPFVQALFDSSCIIVAPDSLGVSNNLIYLWTTQGISAVSEAGVSIASRPIDIEILEVASSRYTNFKKATFGVGYDSDNSYIVWTVSNDIDTVATQAYRYSNLTSSWTKYDLSKTCGIVNPVDDRLYLGAADVAYIEQERKLFNRTDYSDREFHDLINPNAYTSNKLKLNSVVDYSIGDVVLQEQWLTVYDFNSLLRKLDNDPGIGPLLPPVNNYFYTNFKATRGNNLRTKLIELATELDSLGLGFNNYLNSINDYNGSITNISEANPTVITTSSVHNLFSGRVVTIVGSNSTRNIDGTFEISVTGNNTFTIPLSVSTAGSAGLWSTNSQDIRDIKACYNKIIEKLNLDSIVALTNYNLVDSFSIQESVIINIDKVFKILTLSTDLDYVEGDIKIYKAIDTSFTYAPATMGDPLNYKQIREATLMFINKQFTLAKMSFSTDLLPAFIDVEFYGNGSGLFGNNAFGTNFFGGVSHSAPFRTYVPLPCQRCRYINIKYSHKVAREKYGILGITLTGKVGVSTRAYR